MYTHSLAHTHTHRQTVQHMQQLEFDDNIKTKMHEYMNMYTHSLSHTHTHTHRLCSTCSSWSWTMIFACLPTGCARKVRVPAQSCLGYRETGCLWVWELGFRIWGFSSFRGEEREQ